jgi:predicted nuclease of predicted toxin-antitoxin system
MRILLDQNVPIGVRSLLGSEHEIYTANEMGWSRRSDAELLKLAEQSGFDVLVTGDQNMPFQLNLKGRRIRLVTLWTTRWLNLLAEQKRVRRLVLSTD